MSEAPHDFGFGADADVDACAGGAPSRPTAAAAMGVTAATTVASSSPASTPRKRAATVADASVDAAASCALTACLVDVAPFVAQSQRGVAALLGRLVRFTYAEERIWRAAAVALDVGEYSRTPLMHAAFTGNRARLEWLLAHGHGYGARVNALAHAKQTWRRGAPRASDAVTALSLAEDAGDECPDRDAIVAALVGAGAKTLDELWELSAALLIASGVGDVKELRRLRDAGADVNDVFAKDGDEWPEGGGPTPLNAAARGGHTSAVRLLCELGAQTDAHDNSVEGAPHGYTPLIAALDAGHLAAAEVLLECGADPDWPTYGNDTRELAPLAYAIRHCSAEAALLLLRHGATANAFEEGDDGVTFLHTAAQRGDAPLVAALLEGGANVDSTELCGAVSCGTEHQLVPDGARRLTAGDGPTPLILAARGGHLDVIRLLCKRGAHLESRDNCVCDLGRDETPAGDTALIAAIKAGQLGAAKLLLRRGAEVDARSDPDREYGAHPFDAHAYTGLQWAVADGDVRAVELLLRYEADANVFDRSSGWGDGDCGITPLHMAARDGDVRVVKALLKGGADVNAREICLELCESRDSRLHGAKGPRVAVGLGHTPLILAARAGHLDVIRALCKHGAHLEVGDNCICDAFKLRKMPAGDTALIAAIKAGQLGAAELLLRRGAKVDARSDPDRENLPHWGWESVPQRGGLQRRRPPPSADAKEYTPLLWAVAGGNVRAVELLLRHGADVRLREDPSDGDRWGGKRFDETGSGATPLSLAHRSTTKNSAALVAALEAAEAKAAASTETTATAQAAADTAATVAAATAAEKAPDVTARV